MISFQHFSSFSEAQSFCVFYDPSRPETCERYIDGVGPVLGQMPCGAYVLPKEEYCEESQSMGVTADLPDDEGDTYIAWVMQGDNRRHRVMVPATFFSVEPDLYPA